MNIIERLLGTKRFKLFRNEGEGYQVEVPIYWKISSVTAEYGHSFSDPEGQEGVISVKPVLIPGNTLEEYYDALMEGMKKELRYKFIASADIKIGQRPAKEAVFFAPATVKGKKKKAIMTIDIVDDSSRFRYVVLSYSVLQSRYEDYIGIYQHAKKTFRIL
ncbi:MAG TPA: hypothetical protein VJH24_01735 [Candidatus Bilamarchaeaceae archaeon]|nr:hypothetical protein [Candidatus Bilamarchaeaceae archaeon]